MALSLIMKCGLSDNLWTCIGVIAAIKGVFSRLQFLLWIGGGEDQKNLVRNVRLMGVLGFPW